MNYREGSHGGKEAGESPLHLLVLQSTEALEEEKPMVQTLLRVDEARHHIFLVQIFPEPFTRKTSDCFRSR